VLYTYFQVGRTEHNSNCLNPQFSKPLELDYFFEDVQHLCFKVYNLDTYTARVSDDFFLGQIECTLGEV
jgi:C2 domain